MAGKTEKCLISGFHGIALQLKVAYHWGGVDQVSLLTLKTAMERGEIRKGGVWWDIEKI